MMDKVWGGVCEDVTYPEKGFLVSTHNKRSSDLSPHLPASETNGDRNKPDSVTERVLFFHGRRFEAFLCHQAGQKFKQKVENDDRGCGAAETHKPLFHCLQDHG
ncbi:hypothetical protein RRG08_037389 [Elysia crispata]|uniref:Uncharacterized protein n=1 Tax=Elysia crispata TaxID=231223 RepID=A0AAE1AFM2_9GAST|nr:hypothetical protein RRG08_037389 [Elysia crispata]